MHRPVVVTLVVVLVAGCADPGPGDGAAPTDRPDVTGSPEDGPLSPPDTTGDRAPSASAPDVRHAEADLRIDEVATDLVVPWGLAFRADGSALVTERDSGRLLAIDEGGVRVVRTFEIDATGEGGLLGVAVPPGSGADGDIYVYLTTPEDNRVVRMQVGREPEPVITGIPAGRVHDGGRIAFGPDGMLYVATGDAGRERLAQDPDSLAGKILRVAPDGSVPPDNPFPGSPVWTLGHRNVQGLGWTSEGDLYATEFGPDRDDEVNHIERGRNYGWPVVTGQAGDERFADPVLVRQPQDASWSDMAVPAGSALPGWDGDLVVASLRGQRLWVVQLAEDGSVAVAEELFVGRFGRLRVAAEAPDGSIWLLTSNRDGRGEPRPGDDRILRLTVAG